MSDAAILTVVSGLVTITASVVGFLTLWIKLKYGEDKTDKLAKKTDNLTEKTEQVETKLDANTAITKAGTAAAAVNAHTAAVNAQTAAASAADAKIAAEGISKKLNGGIDATIEAAIKPIRDSVQEHSLQDESNMREIRIALDDLRKRIK